MAKVVKRMRDYLAALAALDTDVFTKIEKEYKLRIYVSRRDAGMRKVRYRMVDTGALRDSTKIERDGVRFLDYGVRLEEGWGNYIFDFTEDEIRRIEEFIRDDLYDV